VERLEGPAAAERLVAQVGIDVGGQMEKEFRQATGAGAVALTSEQMAECFVRLKHAIDGDFYLVSVSDHEVVLANRRCPFGDPVKLAPALCRMTSSVFGGIAASNTGAATVLLEERIAVVDHQCKVVITFGDADEAYGHSYRRPATD
jgi:predicted ArsR family transcriptional regulator